MGGRPLGWPLLRQGRRCASRVLRVAFLSMPGIATASAIVAALLLDALLGEPRRAHPLVAFGRWAGRVEAWLWRDAHAAGVLSWLLAVLPWLLLVVVVERLLRDWPGLAWLFSVVLLYAAIGLRSLAEHALPIATALERGELAAARKAVAQVVSRDTAALDARGVASAASESVLENGCDAVFGAVFWFAVLGVPGVLLYRLANTLDAMWGYRTPRYRRFGAFAARLDDVLNFVPARLVTLSYALLGKTVPALHCWRVQGRRWKSPNAGPVMAAGAGALGLALGGAAPYHGVMTERPQLGAGRAADAAGIRAALRLVRRTALLWSVVGSLLAAGLAMVFS